MKYLLTTFMLLLLFPFGAKAAEYIPAPNEFESAIIMQPQSGKVLYAYHPDEPHVAASLTKLLTALVTIKLKPSWDKVVSIEAEDEVGGGRLRVATGSTLTMRDLLYSAITASANNAAMALSRVAGMSREAFVGRMNVMAEELGAKNTVVYDASGMDVRNMTTAHDMARLADVAFDQAMMRSAATVSRYQVHILNTGDIHTVASTNLPFLADDDVWVTGGKTGYLIESQYNLISRLQPYKNGVHDPKQEVIVVVLGAPTRMDSFESAKRLAEWAWARPELFIAPQASENPLSHQLTYGISSAEVKTVQQWLALDADVYPAGVTSGFFGPLTLQAVKKFQVKYGVVSGAGAQGYGVVGPATRERLYAFYLSHKTDTVAAIPSAPQTPDPSISQTGLQQVLVYGQKNNDVKILQSWLSTDKTIYPEGIVSGFFGPLTLQAVKKFQIKYDVVQSQSDRGYGVVGPATRAKLQELYI